MLCGATGREVSLTQEKATQRQLEEAVTDAAAATSCTVTEFAVGSETEGPSTSQASAAGRYLVFVEFARAPHDIDSFRDAVDAGLCSRNFVYRQHRNRDVCIRPPCVIAMPAGTAERFAAAAGRKGWQNKFPHILDNAQRDLLMSLCAGGR